jgi:hypothetical protein
MGDHRLYFNNWGDNLLVDVFIRTLYTFGEFE